MHVEDVALVDHGLVAQRASRLAVPAAILAPALRVCASIMLPLRGHGILVNPLDTQHVTVLVHHALGQMVCASWAVAVPDDQFLTALTCQVQVVGQGGVDLLVVVPPPAAGYKDDHYSTVPPDAVPRTERWPITSPVNCTGSMPRCCTSSLLLASKSSMHCWYPTRSLPFSASRFLSLSSTGIFLGRLSAMVFP